jgi:hypothetical protein
MLDAFDLQIGANRHLTRAVFGRSLPPLLPGSGSGEHSHRSGYLPIHHCPPPPTLGFPLAHTPAPSAPPHPYRDDESIRRCVSERRGRSIRRTTHDTGLAAHPPDVARPVHASAIQLIRPVPVGSRARDARRRGAGQCGGIGQGREMAISINRSKAGRAISRGSWVRCLRIADKQELAVAEQTSLASTHALNAAARTIHVAACQISPSGLESVHQLWSARSRAIGTIRAGTSSAAELRLSAASPISMGSAPGGRRGRGR